MAKKISKNSSFFPKAQIEKRGLLPNARMSVTAAPNIATAPTFFYSPELTPESWLLPKSRQEVLKWAKLFFNLDPYIQSILMMHARYPFSKFHLKHKNTRVKQVFDSAIFGTGFDWLNFMYSASLSYWKFGEFCLAGDTKIPLLNGKEYTIKELYDSNAENFYVYSTTVEGKFVPGMCQKVICNGLRNDIIKVTLDNGESFKCTRDHKILLRNGVYIEAGDLTSGDSIMPLYRKLSEKYEGYKLKKYELIKDNTTDNKWVYTHRAVYHNIYGDVSKGNIIHHIDFDKHNNEPTNLEQLDNIKHRELHVSIASTKEALDRLHEGNKKYWADPKNRLAQSVRKDRFWNHKVLSIESVHPELVYDLVNVAPENNFAISAGVYVHNCAWGDWDTTKKRWNSFITVEPEIVDFNIDPFSGQSTVNLIPTLEIKKMVRDSLMAGKPIPEALIEGILNNKKIPLDAEGIPENNAEGRAYEPPRISLFARLTDPGATRGTPPVQCLFKCLVGDTKIALLDGTNPTIKELADSGRRGFWVYGVDKTGNIVPAKAEMAAYVKHEDTYEVLLDNGDKIIGTKDHPLVLRDGSECQIQNLKSGEMLSQAHTLKVGESVRDHNTTSHVILSVKPTGNVEKVYAVCNAGENHNFMIALSDGSGILSKNTLIYQDKIRLAQIAIADRHHLPIELWTLGHITGDEKTSIIPGDEELQNVREMIIQATQQPPFSIVYTPLLKYEALGVSGKLLSVYEDLGYVENQILVGLGVNKNLILGEGAAFSGSAKTIALHRIIMEYQAIRDLFTNWFIKYVLRPVAIANKLYDDNGMLAIPEVVWEKSLRPEQDKEEFDLMYKLWKDGLVSTKTLYTKLPDDIKYDTEKAELENERFTVFDKGDKRLGKREDFTKDKKKPSLSPSKDEAKPEEPESFPGQADDGSLPDIPSAEDLDIGEESEESIDEESSELLEGPDLPEEASIPAPELGDTIQDTGKQYD